MKPLTPNEWAKTKSLFPIGAVVEGHVAIAWDFMIFVALPGTQALGVVVITSLSDEPPPSTAEDFPGVGEPVKAVVVGHRDEGHQIALSLRKSDFTRSSE
ncbi:RNA-binding protein [Nannocystaceae bacterium ST9]